jgi:arginase
VVGAPSSAGSYAAGQDAAPRVLREHALLERLREKRREVVDVGDGPLQIWTPDRAHPLAQNVGQVIASVTAVANDVGAALDSDSDVLVLGGSCLVALGVMSALASRAQDSCLLYVDRHSDLNTPNTTSDGSLDWMGMSHLLGVSGTIRELLAALGPAPLLTPDRVHLLGIEPEASTVGERQIRADLGMAMTTNAELAANPVEATARALSSLQLGPLAVHLDVDVLDFTDAPLAEDTGGRNTGPTLDALAKALRVACHDPRFRVLSVGELNPTRSAGDPGAIDRFVEALAGLF